MQKQNFITWSGSFEQSRYAAFGLLLREGEFCSATVLLFGWTDEGPLAVVISLEWSRHCHLKLLIVVIVSTTSLAVSTEPPCFCWSWGSLCWSYRSYGCSLQWVNTFMFCASAGPSLLCCVSIYSRVYYLDLQGTSKRVKFSCCCHTGIVFDAVKNPVSHGSSCEALWGSALSRPSPEKLTSVCVMEQTALIQPSPKQYVLCYA